ncbi:hypothetical protein C4D60_Mb09t21350 [Musa balbisiana]|uniref:GST C-terminal domain-containing protein n=1 Tax=Musa balbisiana TaxID=52838 RepID=A0A4V4H3E9_MUSBA|nr:hypothetical protein C4D60_Mb09t21350 [Musa balbisiana]
MLRSLGDGRGWKVEVLRLRFLDYLDRPSWEKLTTSFPRLRVFIGILKLLEGELGGKKYFGGDAFGFVDVALAPFVSWFYSYETCAGFSIEEAAPKVVAWGKRCMGQESVANALSHPDKIYEMVGVLKKKFGVE